jgi:hypothetical protein
MRRYHLPIFSILAEIIAGRNCHILQRYRIWPGLVPARVLYAIRFTALNAKGIFIRNTKYVSERVVGARAADSLPDPIFA